MSSQTEIPAGLADVPVAKSAVSIIDGKRALLSYRGIPVEQLAKDSSYEETTWLLLKGDLPTQRQLADFHHELRQRRKVHYRLIEVIKNFPATGHPMDALQSSIAALGMFYPARNVTNAASNWEATLRLVAPCRRSWPRSLDCAGATTPSSRTPISIMPAISTT